MTVAVHPRQAYFESMYVDSPDPYGTHSRWYEQRKRTLLLACLPRARFRHCYEPGCGSGELTAALAERSDAVLASDFSPAAARAARLRTASLPNVRIEHHAIPQAWPQDQTFDLIVLSEIGYFLDGAAMAAIARRCRASLAADGVLVACDWLPDFAERASATHAVHAALAASGLARLAMHREEDFELVVWSRDPRSVAQREGIR